MMINYAAVLHNRPKGDDGEQKLLRYLSIYHLSFVQCSDPPMDLCRLIDDALHF